MKKLVSILVPCYNEESSLPHLFEEVYNHCLFNEYRGFTTIFSNICDPINGRFLLVTLELEGKYPFQKLDRVL